MRWKVGDFGEGVWVVGSNGSYHSYDLSDVLWNEDEIPFTWNTIIYYETLNIPTPSLAVRGPDDVCHEKWENDIYVPQNS